MRQSYLLLLMILIILSNKAFGQTSTEQFETESNGSTSFTDNGVIFNIISNVNTYDIQANYPGTGWNGTSADNRYIDNSGAGNQSAGTSFSIKTTSNLFKVNRFWVYAAAGNGTLGVAGTLTITGKLSGVTKFTQTKTTGFTTTIGTANGYTLIDLTNLNGQNYSNIVIDQIQITAGGNFQYLALDAFTWVKDSGIVLGSLTLNAAAQTNVSCNGGSNGSATVGVTGGTAPYTYSWSPSGGTAATATGLSAGTYTVTVTDATNTTKTQSFTITQPTALSATTSQTNIACNGGSTGIATINVSGGTAPYTYSWSPSGGTAATATGLSAGTYTVTVTDANSCTLTRTFSITQPTAISTTGSQTNVACNGASNGSATVTASGGTGPYTYSWAPSGGTAATATGLVAGTYTVTITDANNCSATRTFTITQPTALSATTSQTNIVCNGGSTGVATINVSGGTAPYTYSWSPSGGTAATATGLSAGTYTVTVTDANSCTLTRTFTITQPTAISTTGSQTNVACNGASNGSATVTASGGTGPYTYSWAPSGGTAATATGLTAGTYTVTITDANNCSATRTFTITQPTAISTTGSQTNVACNGASNGSATVTASGGTAPYTYSWSPSGGTAATATGLVAGTYTVTITDANNCSATRTFTITQPTALSATTSQTNIACNGGSTGVATINVSGGTAPYTYSWSPSGGTAATATGLSAGTYTVTVTDANSCTLTRTFSITQPTAISTTGSQTNVACNGASNGSATVTASGGTGPYTYSWSPSGGTAATATGLTAGTYTVTITDANNCSATRTFTITQPTALSATTSQTNIACNGGSTGVATINVSGGTAPYTYSWSPSGGTAATATGLSAGTYTVTVTDANSCTLTRTFTITQPTAISTTGSQTNVACNGASNGSATVTASGGTGPYTYSWAPSGGTAATATGLAAGTYTVTITDANNCSATRTFTITQPTALSATTSQTNIACNGGSTGVATINVSGGTAPYTYSWSPSGGTAATATGLSAGTYTVTVTDANSCTLTRTFTITQPTAISTTGSQTNVACNGASNGSATVTASGGTGPYTYSWAPSGGTAATATGLVAGTYTVTITDANNCSATRTFTITQPASAVSGTTVVTNVACNGASNGAINLTPAGGTAPYTFNWGGGITTEDRTGLAAGTYTVIITDANGCTATVNATVTQPASAVSGTTVVTNVACNGASNGAINLTPAGGTAPYTFNWGGGITTEDRTGLAAGTYTVIITDANGCTATVNATVTQPASAVSGTTVVTNVACNGASNGAINLTPAGGTAPYTFNWGGGITTEDRTGLAAGTYTVIITDANGCTATVNATVTQPASAVSGTTVVTNVACNGASNGAINLTPAGGTAPYTFNWGGGITTEDRTGLAAGTYTVIITDANGCTATVNATVTQPASAVSGTTVVTNVACNGASNGAINLTPAGGTAPYTFNWGGGITTEDRTGLAAGTYTVIITDANGCTATVNATVTQPASAVSGTTVVTNVACNGASNGAINLTPAGGTAPYTFNWGGGITTEDRTGLAAGTYTVIITDANGCTATVNATVTQPASAVSGTTVVTNVACNGASNGAINLTPAGGTAPYTFNWGGGITTEDRTGLAAGTYTVIITDANGCTATVNATVTQPTALSATTSQTNIACNGGSTGVATINVSGGTAPYTYSWSPSGGTAATATGLSAGTYTVTVTDANSCTLTRTFTITQPTAISTTGSQTNVACNGASNGSATVTASGGTGPYTYSWAPSGGTAATATGLAAGTYTVTITDANNCSATRTFTITQAAPVAAPTGLAIQNFVSGSTLSTLVVNGQNIKWYASASDASNHVNVLPISTLLVNNTTYYATQTIGGCESQLSLAVTVIDGTLGVSNVTGPTKIQIYPNPVHDVLQFTGEIKIDKVIILSIDGRKVTEKIMEDQRKLDVSHLVQGTYLIQIVTKQGIQTMKFIKK